MAPGEQRNDASYTYNPIWRAIQREKWILLTVAVVCGLVVAYRFTFPQVHIGAERLPKYLRVIRDFDSLVGNLEQIRDRERDKKGKGGVGAVDAAQPKMGLYLIFDYMFVMELREDSPFFPGYPSQEKDLIRALHRLGGMIDHALIELYESSGNPDVPMDFAAMRGELEKARAIYEKEARN